MAADLKELSKHMNAVEENVRMLTLQIARAVGGGVSQEQGN